MPGIQTHKAVIDHLEKVQQCKYFKNSLNSTSRAFSSSFWLNVIKISTVLLLDSLLLHGKKKLSRGNMERERKRETEMLNELGLRSSLQDPFCETVELIHKIICFWFLLWRQATHRFPSERTINSAEVWGGRGKWENFCRKNLSVC